MHFLCNDILCSKSIAVLVLLTVMPVYWMVCMLFGQLNVFVEVCTLFNPRNMYCLQPQTACLPQKVCVLCQGATKSGV